MATGVARYRSRQFDHVFFPAMATIILVIAIARIPYHINA